ncbi:MAG: aa3-type cytochrome c oxidase subunit IV [Rhizobiaceae bacterium]|nr:aa3-type cytochrome c oxidase subunit IV [Rhizobiaceae bacterium]MBL4732641.1 aa3-type cytochrome c oxidase subunit IV [Rhizobiaceae bacterium]
MAKNAKSSTPENAMDYSEHEKTYDAFISLTKWGVVFCVALMVAMSFGFFAGGGLFGGTLLLIILMVIAYFAI